MQNNTYDICTSTPHLSPIHILLGEGFHNFHHTFPFDYSTSEFGLRFNPTTCFIDLMCWMSLASNRKKASVEIIQARKLRTGDGSYGAVNTRQEK